MLWGLVESREENLISWGFGVPQRPQRRRKAVCICRNSPVDLSYAYLTYPIFPVHINSVGYRMEITPTSNIMGLGLGEEIDCVENLECRRLVVIVKRNLDPTSVPGNLLHLPLAWSKFLWE